MKTRRLFNNKVQIETREKILTNDNRWISKYSFWKEVWASISIKDMSPKRTLYLFMIKWKHNLPSDFRVKLNDKIFFPTQIPVVDPCSDTVIFHAVVNQ